MRSIVGLKKESDRTSLETTHRTAAAPDVIRLIGSLAIGAIAGGLAGLTMLSAEFGETQTIAILITAGYAGADFIEGFMKRSLPQTGHAGIQTEQPATAPGAIPRATFDVEAPPLKPIASQKSPITEAAFQANAPALAPLPAKSDHK